MPIIKKYDQNLMRYLNAFEHVTKIRAKDCLVINDTLFFIVARGTARIAIGRQGAGVKALNSALEKKVKILEWADDAEGLVKAYLFPVRAQGVKQTSDSTIEISFKFAMQRRNLLSDRQARLKELLTVVQHFYPMVKNIKIL